MVFHIPIFIFGSDDMTLGKNKQSQLVNSSLDILKGSWDETKGIQEGSKIEVYGIYLLCLGERGDTKTVLVNSHLKIYRRKDYVYSTFSLGYLGYL